MGNDRERRRDEEPTWYVQIDLPAKMVKDFGQWWETEGWWNFRAWHERNWEPESEWERFMRRLWGDPPAVKREALCAGKRDPTT